MSRSHVYFQRSTGSATRRISSAGSNCSMRPRNACGVRRSRAKSRSRPPTSAVARLFCEYTFMDRRKGHMANDVFFRTVRDAYDLGAREIGNFAGAEPLACKSLESYIATVTNSASNISISRPTVRWPIALGGNGFSMPACGRSNSRSTPVPAKRISRFTAGTISTR